MITAKISREKLTALLKHIMHYFTKKLKCEGRVEILKCFSCSSAAQERINLLFTTKIMSEFNADNKFLKASEPFRLNIKDPSAG
jgi:hypothetical protein